MVAKSTADVEFNSTAWTAEDGLWLQKLQSKLDGCEREHERESECENGSEKTALVSVFNDNQPFIARLKSGQFKPSTRHVGIKYFCLRDVEIAYVRTNEMVTDGLTKGSERGKHTRIIDILSYST